MHRDLVQFLARSDQGRGKRWFVGCVREVLRFQAKGIVAASSGRTLIAGQVIGRIQLHARLSRFDFQHASRFRVFHTSGQVAAFRAGL